MTFPGTRSAARRLIRNLRHRHGFPPTRPAILLGKGKADTTEWRKSSLVDLFALGSFTACEADKRFHL